MAETIIKHVSAENLKQYDGLIKQYLETKDAAVKSALEEQIDIVAQAIQAEETRAKKAEQTNATAASNAQTTADQAQANIDILAGKVGEVAEGKTVVGMIEDVIADAYDDTEVRELISGLDTNKADKTQVATDIAAAVKAEEDARKEAVAGVHGEVDSLEQTVAGNKTAIEGTVATLEQKVDANESDIEGKMTALTGRVAANETAVKTTLPNAINAEKERAEGKEEELAGAIAAVKEDVDAFFADADMTASAKDTLKELQEYIASDESGASAMAASIKANADAIDAVEADVAKRALQASLDTAVSTLEGVDAEQAAKISALEQKVGSSNVAADIAQAKTEAIEAAATDAANKANQALADAKTYTNTEVAKDRLRLDSLEADTHTHGNKALLDTYKQTEANLADAVSKKHSHANATVLDGVTSAKVSAWDASEQNAKTYAKDYADGLNEALTTKVDANTAYIESISFMSTTEVENLFA